MSLKHSVLRFKFPGFADLPKNEIVESETLADSCGNRWRLLLVAEFCGADDEESNEPKVSLYLENLGTKDICLKLSVILRDACGRAITERSRDVAFKAGKVWGTREFIERSKVLDGKENILVGGALVIDVHLQIESDGNLTYEPSISIAKKMLDLLERGDDADVVFKVGVDDIPAHKLMLKVNAPMLFEFCEGRADGAPIVIDNIAPEDFRTVLRYVYAHELPSRKSIRDNGKNILDAANRFGLLDLKLLIETALVKFIHLNVDNIADWLLFADSKTCPLLKEYAMSFIVARSEDVLDNLDLSKRLEESPKLLMEVMKEFSKKLNGDECFGDGKPPPVNELRKRLREEGLDVDGTKEMLVARLNDSNKRRKTEE